MEKKYVKPFLDTTKKIAETFFDTSFQQSENTLEKTLGMDKEMVVALALKDGLTGLALFGMKKEEASQLARKVMKVNKLDVKTKEEETELIKSVILEFGNQVMGRVAGAYEDAGMECDISIPKFVAEPEALTGYRKESVAFTLECEEADIFVKLHIEKSTV